MPNDDFPNYPIDALIVVTDKKYLKHLEVLLLSLNKTNHKITVYACLINIPESKNLNNKLKKLYPFLDLSYLKKQFTSSQNKKAFASNYRVSFIRSILKLHHQLVLYLDVDSIVRKNLINAKISPSSDIEILFRKTGDLRMKVATGAIILRNNKQSHLFLKHWETRITPNIFEWFSDQISFYQTYKRIKDKINISSIDKSLIDWEFHPESIVWAGKGDRKYRNILYVLESAKLRAFNKFLKKLINKLQQYFTES
jgi:hypothetical protein